MNCAVVVPTVTHSGNTSNIYNHHANPISPNLMVRFQQLEGQVRNHHHHNELPLMKRKRPARINVPIVTLMENNVVSTPRDRVEEIEVEEEGYGVCSKRGKSRAHLEDRYSARVNDVHGCPLQAFFGVFDGHGGPKAAEFAAARLGDKILDHVGRVTGAKSSKLIEESIRDGYLAADQEFLNEKSNGGACCVTALIQEGNLMVSNVGDCRAVISRGGLAEALTTDQSPSREDEKTRIESKGGYVDFCNGTWRIQGSLAVSRAIGDQHLKQWVTAEPETKILTIKPDFEFLILASDGLWNKVSNQEAVDVVLPFFTAGSNKPELKHACRKLVELSTSRGSNDDTTVMVIQLDKFAL
ncbi:probable protein phosphatase 2C 2 [Chenopodium quinoa]|uniref:protein-serine/threonine phosphatase n=1 Tax=Chenopodium quinoa TaxID=63459 RepID=A0A803NBW6_CHEQI|nr:probable protein phosphatase 2C 2 [Chenopodium quinoa]XP_021732492.1 probable protein phosphatase 2C 2 [Chenopodium quinoa]